MNNLRKDIVTTYGTREDSSHEWKVEWNDRCVADVCAFHNTDGGMLIIGRRNDGTFIDVRNPSEIVETIQSTVRREISVLVEPRVEVIDDKACVVVPVNSGNGVAMCNLGFLARSWDMNIRCNKEMLVEIMRKKYHDGWFSQPLDIEIHALSERLMGEYVSLCSKNVVPFSEDPRSKTMEYLDYYHLTIERKPTLVSAMLFLERPRDVDCGAYLKIRVYDTDGIEVVKRDIDSSVIEIAEIAVSAMSELLKGQFGIDMDVRYPVDAIRETIVNAVEHKDYSKAEPVVVSLYDNSMIISNPVRDGTKKEEQVQGLRTGHRINPELCRAIESAGLATGFGIGLERIKRNCNEIGCPEPLIMIKNGMFSVTLYPADERTVPMKQDKRTIAVHNGLEQEGIVDEC